MANTVPKEVKKEQIDRFIAETWKVCLLTSAFTYVTGTYITYSNLVNELPNGSGYTTGGATVAKYWWGGGSGYTGTTNVMIDAADTAWTGITFTGVRYVVVYETTGGKIRGIYDLVTDRAITDGTFTINWNAGGLIKIS